MPDEVKTDTQQTTTAQVTQPIIGQGTTQAQTQAQTQAPRDVAPPVTVAPADDPRWAEMQRQSADALARQSALEARIAAQEGQILGARLSALLLEAGASSPRVAGLVDQTGLWKDGVLDEASLAKRVADLKASDPALFLRGTQGIPDAGAGGGHPPAKPTWENTMDSDVLQVTDRGFTYLAGKHAKKVAALTAQKNNPLVGGIPLFN